MNRNRSKKYTIQFNATYVPVHFKLYNIVVEYILETI